LPLLYHEEPGLTTGRICFTWKAANNDFVAQVKSSINLSEIGFLAGGLATGTGASNLLISYQNVSFYYFYPVNGNLKSEKSGQQAIVFVVLLM
jgi:hypothetical protein